MCKVFTFWHLPSRNVSKIVWLKHSSQSNRADIGMVGQDLSLGFLWFLWVRLLGWKGFSLLAAFLLPKHPKRFCPPCPCVPLVLTNSLPLQLFIPWYFAIILFLVSQKLPSAGACCLGSQDFPRAGTTSLPTSLGRSWVEAHPSPPVSSPGPLGSGLLLAACPQVAGQPHCCNRTTGKQAFFPRQQIQSWLELIHGPWSP